MDVQTIILLLFLVLVGLFLFAIYFVFKVLDFFVNATRLYRQMVHRQDATIKLLLDIRDNTKTADVSGLDTSDDDQQDEISADDGEVDDQETTDPDDGEEEEESEDLDTCYHCGEELKAPTGKCPSGGKELK